MIGDPTRLRQVLVNLISNAIKFTEKGEIVVSVKMVSLNENEVEVDFRVRDTGVGVPVEKLELIFDKFTQADNSTTRQYGGTGLGLAISQKIVEMMGGKLQVESVVGRGSVFGFKVKFGSDPICRQSIRVEGMDLSGHRVLIVDDSETNRLILHKILEQWQAEVEEVASGEEALSVLAEAHNSGRLFSLVLLDYHMPGMDGLATLEKIQEGHGAGLPVIMLSSANAGREQVDRMQSLNLSGYAAKPVKMTELRILVLRALGQAANAGDEEGPKVSEAASGRPLHILLAEDNIDNRNLIVAYLKKTPHRLDCAENGRIAVEKFMAGVYDLVLMDIEMPEMDGYSATARIRQWEKEHERPETVIIALTAHALREHHEKCIAAGCNDHVTKPIKKSVLLGLLAGLQGENDGETIASGTS